MRPVSSLDHLRKQAKLYLRWHRDRYFPVAARIRSLLPRFAETSDIDIFTSPFKLSDAQELVARKSGFQSWPALVKGLEAMSTTAIDTVAPTIIIAAEPQILVTDFDTACAFYCNKLGFRCAFAYGQPTFYGQVVRDGASLNLRQVRGPIYDDGMRSREPDVVAATLTLDDAKPLYLQLKAAGVTFHQALRTEPWGARTFIVRDPDENLILFAGRAG